MCPATSCRSTNALLVTYKLHTLKNGKTSPCRASLLLSFHSGLFATGQDCLIHRYLGNSDMCDTRLSLCATWTTPTVVRVAAQSRPAHNEMRCGGRPRLQIKGIIYNRPKKSTGLEEKGSAASCERSAEDVKREKKERKTGRGFRVIQLRPNASLGLSIAKAGWQHCKGRERERETERKRQERKE